MMSGKDGIGQIIKACMTVVTLVALPGRFRVITAALDDLFGLARGAFDAVWPAQFTDGLITLDVIDEILDVDLHRWTPVRVRDMRYHQFTRSSIPRPWNPIRASGVCDGLAHPLWPMGATASSPGQRANPQATLDATATAPLHPGGQD